MSPFLITQRGPVIGHRHDLDSGQFTIGRGQDNDLVLNDAMVSRYHAVIRQENAGVVLIDLGSTNPALVNDMPLEPGVPHLMFYAPGVTNAQVGSSGEAHAAPGLPFVIGEGTPQAYLVVLLPPPAGSGEEQ